MSEKYKLKKLINTLIDSLQHDSNKLMDAYIDTDNVDALEASAELDKYISELCDINNSIHILPDPKPIPTIRRCL